MNNPISISRSTAVYLVRRLTEYIQQAWGCDYNPMEPLRNINFNRPGIVGELPGIAERHWLDTLVGFMRFMAGILAHDLADNEVGLLPNIDEIAIDTVDETLDISDLLDQE
jgi:hypothetical protein